MTQKPGMPPSVLRGAEDKRTTWLVCGSLCPSIHPNLVLPLLCGPVTATGSGHHNMVAFSALYDPTARERDYIGAGNPLERFLCPPLSLGAAMQMLSAWVCSDVSVLSPW